MLVLSRKRGEQIRIGPSIEVTVLAISKGRVRLGFSGPPEVAIHRQEVYRQIQAGRSKELGAPAHLAQHVA
jgi:carbon storage regulator